MRLRELIFPNKINNRTLAGELDILTPYQFVINDTVCLKHRKEIFMKR